MLLLLLLLPLLLLLLLLLLLFIIFIYFVSFTFFSVCISRNFDSTTNVKCRNLLILYTALHSLRCLSLSLSPRTHTVFVCTRALAHHQLNSMFLTRFLSMLLSGREEVYDEVVKSTHACDGDDLNLKVNCVKITTVTTTSHYNETHLT